MQLATGQWIPLSEAAKMYGVSQAKLSRMIKAKRFQTRRNPKDERQTLVNTDELNRYFNPQE